MSAHVLDSIDPASLGTQLAAARKARGLTQQQAADALGVTRTTITAMEKGDRRPRAAELVTLANLYGRQVGELVRPAAIPASENFIVHFRAAWRGGESGEQKRDDDINLFQQLCTNYVELEQLIGAPLPRRFPDPYDVRGSNPEQAAEEVANSERNRLGLGDGPIGDMWALLETDVGLRVFAPRFSDTSLAGLFIYSESIGGCIAVNGHQPEERRRWTAAHEFAHFLTDRHRAEITVLLRYRRVPDHERFADAFAKFFLMPTSGLVRRFQALKRSKEGPMTPPDVLALCHLYKVSFEALILRLEELKLVHSGSWDRLRSAGFKPTTARQHMELPALTRELPELPMRYQALAIKAFTNCQLSEERLAAFLRTDRVTARDRVQKLTTSDVLDNGEWRQVSLDFGFELTSEVS